MDPVIRTPAVHINMCRPKCCCSRCYLVSIMVSVGCLPCTSSAQSEPGSSVAMRSWLVLEQWVRPQVWQTVSGSPIGEQQLMLAAAKQGVLDTVRA